jgi:outer membrane biosynthesis protein TonB
MKKVFGPRTAVEAVVLVAVPVIALATGQDNWVIVASAAIAYLIILAVEAYLGRTQQSPAPQPAAPPAAPVPLPETVRVLPPAPAAEPEPIPVTVAEPEPQPEPEPEPEPEAAPEAPVLRSVPEPPPEPAPAPVFEEPSPVVVPIGVGAEPREWNLWDLERLTREHAGGDDARDQERSFLLMYLRDFAGPDGLLPIDFDSLVRDSFGDLVGAR